MLTLASSSQQESIRFISTDAFSFSLNTNLIIPKLTNGTFSYVHAVESLT